MDGASTTPVEGTSDIKNALEIITEGANPHKVSLPVQMAMQHYQKPKKQIKTYEVKSNIKDYLQLVESEKQEVQTAKREQIARQARIVAERVLNKTNEGATRADGEYRPPAEGPVGQAAEAGLATTMGKVAQEFAAANKIHVPPEVIGGIIKRSLVKYGFPVVNLGFVTLDVVDRLKDDDFAGAAMSMVSGIVGLEPGPGQVAAITLDVINQIRDYRDKRGYFAGDDKPTTTPAKKDVSNATPFGNTGGGAATGNPRITDQNKKRKQTVDEGDEA